METVIHVFLTGWLDFCYSLLSGIRKKKKKKKKKKKSPSHLQLIQKLRCQDFDSSW